MSLKMIKGKTVEEQIRSIDGLLTSINRKQELKPQYEKYQDVLKKMREQINAICEHLGIELNKVSGIQVKQVKLVEIEGETVDVTDKSIS